MKKKSLNRLSAFFNILLVVLLLLPNFLVSASVFAVNTVDPVFPSTNETNKTNGWAQVNELSKLPGSTNFEFKSTRSFWSCFEYRTDGDTSQVITENGGNNYNTLVIDGLYPYKCVNNSTEELTISANEFVEIRLTFGAEGDERFAWTRFDVLPVPVPPSIPVLEYPIDGVAINDNTPLMQWSDSTDSDGSVSHYLYRVFYNCTNVEDIPNSCSVYPNLDGLRVNASQYQAGTTNDNIYYWQVRAVDNEGNLSAWSEPEKVIIDTVLPTKPVFTAPENNLKSTVNSITLNWTGGDDSGSGIKNHIFGYTFTSAQTGNVSFWNTGLLSGNPHTRTGSYGHGEGKYEFYVKTIDYAGNESPLSDILTVYYDGTAPVMPLGLYWKDLDNNQQIMCGGYSNTHHVSEYWDAVMGDVSFSHYEYSSFNAPNGSAGLVERRFDTNFFDSSWWNIPMEGTYGFRVRSVDTFGNKSNWALTDPIGFDGSCKITIDWTAPVGDITGIRYSTDSTNFITNDNTPLIYGTYGDNYEIDTVEVKIGDVSVTPALNGIWTAQFPTITDGIHTISLKITDKAGNITEVTKNITIDSVAPSAVYTHYIKGVLFEGDVAEVKSLSDLSFTGIYTDLGPSSGLKYDSYVIFQAQDDGSFGFAANGKQSYCSWRTSPNLVDLSGSTYNLTDQIQFTNCIATLPDGEYYMAHHVYDNAVRNDIPSINQFRDVLGLHFRINNTPEVTITTPYTEVVQGALSFTVQADAIDGNTPLTYEWTASNGFTSTEKSFVFIPSTVGIYAYTIKVTDADGDTDQETVTITVKAPVEQPAIDTPAVQGTTNTITPVVTRRPLVASNVLGTSTEFVQEDTEEVPEVLGEEDTTCTAESVSGHVYMDNDENNIWDQADESFSGIKIKITTKEKDEEKIVEEFLTDEQGAWKTTLCAGTYYISIDTTSIPDGYKLIGDSTVKIDILDDTKDEVEQSFLLSESKTFLQKYWWIILLAILLVTGIVIASSKKEEQQYS